jgi:hypothetical protein
MITQQQEQAIDNWIETYKPRENIISGDMGWNRLIFETYGDDLEYVMSQPSDKVWTWVDTDDGTAIINGYHLVNRIGYFVTLLPWRDDVTIQVDTYGEGETK